MVSSSGAIIAASATVSAAVLGSFVFYIWRTRIEKKNLRKALICEIASIVDTLETMENVVKDQEDKDKQIPKPILHSLPTNVFEENISEIGRLSGEEVYSVVEFYSTILSFEAVHENISLGWISDKFTSETARGMFRDYQVLGQESVEELSKKVE